ncbi:gamma-butyrobetaine hydroxylase-like domain-containing protein [Chitinibacter bivalviorum]|uniref:gamma-butyrobetaine hydroxylase-like domain-containing protein n=1 Tax=Chitinibacter bivalviorum TaxID=2739434 RepID=UPI003F68C324
MKPLMAGLNADTPQPTELTLHQASRVLEIAFSDDARFQLPCEYLRVSSPSAEVRGHGVGNEVLQVGKINVNIKDIEPVGHYAVKLVFDDGHDSGLFSWQYLYELGANYDANWQKYLNELAAAGASREPL